MGLVGAAIQTAGGGIDAIKEQLWGSTGITNASGLISEGLGKVAGKLLGNENIQNKFLKEGGLEGGPAKAINPHFELFFESVAPRTFSFDFKI